MAWWLGSALALQVVGSIVVVFEVREGHRRWRENFGGPVEIRWAGVVQPETARFAIHAEQEGTDGLTVEERLDRVEKQQDEDKAALHERIRDVSDQMPAVAEDAARKVEIRLRPEIAKALGVLAGMGHRPWWLPWWLGPVLLLVGTVIGGGASVVGELS